jgi:hypothetical protein
LKAACAARLLLPLLLLLLDAGIVIVKGDPSLQEANNIDRSR